MCFIANGTGSKIAKATYSVAHSFTYLNTNFSRSSISIAVPGVAVFGGDSLLLGGCY